VKSVRGDRTRTDVTRVEGADREAELARMIGGADVSAAVLASARDMLASRARADRASPRGTAPARSAPNPGSPRTRK
jgi:hypothetical protein